MRGEDPHWARGPSKGRGILEALQSATVKVRSRVEDRRVGKSQAVGFNGFCSYDVRTLEPTIFPKDADSTEEESFAPAARGALKVALETWVQPGEENAAAARERAARTLS